jgi:hypothetical protein
MGELDRINYILIGAGSQKYTDIEIDPHSLFSPKNVLGIFKKKERFRLSNVETLI